MFCVSFCIFFQQLSFLTINIQNWNLSVIDCWQWCEVGARKHYVFLFGYSEPRLYFTTALQGHLCHKWTNYNLGFAPGLFIEQPFLFHWSTCLSLQQYCTVSIGLGTLQGKSSSSRLSLWFEKWQIIFLVKVPHIFRIKSKLLTRAYNVLHVLDTVDYSDFLS